MGPPENEDSGSKTEGVEGRVGSFEGKVGGDYADESELNDPAQLSENGRKNGMVIHSDESGDQNMER